MGKWGWGMGPKRMGNLKSKIVRLSAHAEV
jgi:hypothetical protein